MLELELVMGRWKEETGRIDVGFMNGEFDVFGYYHYRKRIRCSNANTIFT
jgi:hypothetical protein